MPEKLFDIGFVQERIIASELRINGWAFAQMSSDESEALRYLTICKTLRQIHSFTTQLQFDQKLRELSAELDTEGDEEKCSLIETQRDVVLRVCNGLRFFWGKSDEPYGNMHSLRNLYRVQRAIEYPIWSSGWSFQEELKPDLFLTSEDRSDPVKKLYESLNLGSLVCVSERWAGSTRNPNAGLTGEVVGYEVGLQGLCNAGYLIIYLKQENDWIKDAYLYTLDHIN